ncbi:hypothetical protein [Desulfovibrio sp. ZJ746]|uniref:hypothetical protein n=1 Tax=Desulfovibrio sp. ZJ746 TaxID=2709795 RepID=UPI0013EC2D01|nr:hypothetical protein [Desulfovibrio sp. ZJ746]
MLKAIINGVGTVRFSIDAMGDTFEAQRVGAKWDVVKKNVERLLAKRDPERIKVALYPTITRKTLPCVLDLCRWAEYNKIDAVHLHYYDPIGGGIEERPTLAEQKLLFKSLQEQEREREREREREKESV